MSFDASVTPKDTSSFISRIISAIACREPVLPSVLHTLRVYRLKIYGLKIYNLGVFKQKSSNLKLPAIAQSDFKLTANAKAVTGISATGFTVKPHVYKILSENSMGRALAGQRKKWISRLLFIGAIGLYSHAPYAIANPGKHAASDTFTVPFAANIHRYSAQNNELLSVSRVLLSQDGMKVTELRGQDAVPVNDFIHNFNSSQIWLDSIYRKQFVELPIVAVGATGDFTVTPAESERSGLLTGIPCLGFIPTFRSILAWRGSEVEEWHCRNSNNVTIQYYDPHIQRVVREIYPDGRSVEVTDYREITIDPGIFYPNVLHDAVKPSEFFQKSKPLTGYQSPRNDF